jgi:NADH-quinone oxidoreductase subunit C
VSKELNLWLDELLDDIENVRFRRKSSRRIRVDVASDALPALLELLQGRASYVHLSAISCVDWIDEGEFELVYHVWSYETQSLVSAHTRIPREPGVYLSIYDLYQPAAFFERDIHEMFGIEFEGCPCLEKFILTEWNGPPPMRKEFDGEAFVYQQVNWQTYHPDWLKELEAEGGGITTRPEDIR